MLNVRLLSGICSQWQKVALGCRHEDLCTLQEKYDGCYLSSSRKPSPKPTQEGFFALFERSITHIQNAFAFTLAIRRRIISETASHFTCWRENSATWFEWVNRLVISSNSQFLTLTVKWLTTSTFVHYFFVFFVLSIFTLISLNSPEHFVACPR